MLRLYQMAAYGRRGRDPRFDDTDERSDVRSLQRAAADANAVDVSSGAAAAARLLQVASFCAPWHLALYPFARWRRSSKLRWSGPASVDPN